MTTEDAATAASSSMTTNTPMARPNAAAMAAALAPKPVTGPPAPNSDIIFFINAAFRKEFDVCAQLTSEHDVVHFEADLVQKLNGAETITYLTSLRVPKGCLMRAKVHPIFRRLLVQSMWLQQQPAMLRYKGSEKAIDPKAPVCVCANPPCANPAVRFVGNPGFFLQKNLLVDPFCTPVCMDTKCVLQAQQMSNTIHAQAQQQASGSNLGQTSKFAALGGVNPALKSQMPKDVKSCNVCGSFERAYGGSAHVLKACPLCGIAYYCSQQCQIQDWQRGHKDVCTNAQGGSQQAQALAQKQKELAEQQKKLKEQQQQQQPATIPEDGAAAAPANTTPLAAAPSPIPYHTMPAPAPAPAPRPMQQQQPIAKKKKAPPVASSVSTPGMAELTQAMAATTIQLPTYNMPEPEVKEMPQRTVSAPSAVTMPTYNMPEPAVPVPNIPTKQQHAAPQRAVSEGMAPYGGTPTFAAGLPAVAMAPAGNTADAAADSKPPATKGRKKAE